jgi:hypothetical protein
MNPFETETMANLYLRQGQRERALAIYRRLHERTSDEAARARIAHRIAAVEHDAAEEQRRRLPPADLPPLPIPGVRARSAGPALTLDWRLPPDVPDPVLEVLLVTRGAAGVKTESRTLPVDGPSGRMVLEIPDLHSARVAAGHRAHDRFIPLARG